MFLMGGPDGERAVISASDLRAAAECEFALLRDFDVRLGRSEGAAVAVDPVMARAADLGTAHEQRVLRDLLRTHPGGVVQIESPAPRTRETYAAAARRTLDVLASPAQVVYQAVLFDGRFVGFADFLIREGETWTVCDTKLARREQVSALLQIAAYADELQSAGVPTSPVGRLILGDGVEHDAALCDIVPVYRERRARLLQVLDTHQDDAAPVLWGDERWLACGRCAACVEQLEAHRDVLLVAGVRVATRKRLHAAGVFTLEDLAAREEPVARVGASMLERLRAQARLQLRQEASADGTVFSEVHGPSALSILPRPSAGDLFFDFEGDPLWSEPGSSDWGLEYLFGMVDPGGAPTFRAFWAHDRAAEKQALVDFLAFVAARRREHPDMHIYHYAPYEKSALLRLAARHGVGETDVDGLLADGILVDLYAVVRNAIRVSQRSYSIKKLEPLYMGEAHREGEVTTAGDSIVVYQQFTQAGLEGRADEARALLASIADYNTDDCVSTLRLRDWLLGQAAAAGVEIGVLPDPGDTTAEPHPLEQALRARVGDVPRHRRSADQQAVAMVAATLQYHRREAKPYWWGHFDRLRTPVDEWVREADLFHVERGVVDDRGWFKQGRQRSLRRVLVLHGQFAAGATVHAGTTLKTVYAQPVPSGMPVLPGHLASCPGQVVVLKRLQEAEGDLLVVEETLAAGVAAHDALPVALTPGSPIPTRSIDAALEELGVEVARALPRPDDLVGDALPGSLPSLPAQPGLDLLRRLPPRLRGGGPLPPVGSGASRHVDAITAAVLDLDRSYLAVQGPPGTGKTFVASQVIARLVREHGWKVGVVAQSHAAVENVLAAVVRAGVDPAAVGKHSRAADPPWTDLPDKDLAAFAARQPGGYVLGGTAWDVTNTARVERGQLDLLVVDEAGQYSLAATLACSRAADRLLLLGDPQQLAQVSQGSHPEPVDTSSLGWLIGERPIIDTTHGYLLDTTWRMHPSLTECVSALSYAGRLASEESVTAARRLEGLDPGLHVVTVPHRDNSTESVEEAREVARIAQSLMGSSWEAPEVRDPEGLPVGPRPLGQGDVLVVTPYNSQVRRLREELDDVGLDQVAVGTVDNFQGQEAPVVIVSMAASARSDVSRGIGFLLDRNRLNVAVSRGQWAAIILRSDVLTDFSPASPAELLALGAFIGLCDRAARVPTTV